MKLSSNFSSQGWDIKYGMYEPEDAKNEDLNSVVFVHGTPWSSEVFKPLAKALLATRRYRVLLYDLPGYGQSQIHHKQDDTQSTESKYLFEVDMQQGTSVKAQASVLAALLSFLRLDGQNSNPIPSVIAHDIAGSIVLRTHLIHKCEFRSLMLMDTNTVLPWGDGFYKLARSNPQVFIDMPPSIFEAVVRAVIRSASHDPSTWPSHWEDLLAKPWIGEAWRQRSFVRQIAQANDEDVREMLDQDMYSKVKCDVKILWGEQDQWIPKHKMEQLGGILGEKMKEFVVVPEAGHLLMIDQPERVAIEVAEWLGKY